MGLWAKQSTWRLSGCDFIWSLRDRFRIGGVVLQAPAIGQRFPGGETGQSVARAIGVSLGLGD